MELLPGEGLKSVNCKKSDLCKKRQSEMEFKEFEPRFKSAKTRLKLSASLNIETFDTI